MRRSRANSTGQVASPDHQLERLFNLYDVQRNGSVCIGDFAFVHSIANQLMRGSNAVMRGSSNGGLKGSVGSMGHKGNTSKPSSLRSPGRSPGGDDSRTPAHQYTRSPLPEEYAKATFSNVDLDSDGCISRHDFHSWLTGLIARISKGSGVDHKDPKILLQHLTHMLQSDKRYLAYRSLALAATRSVTEPAEGIIKQELVILAVTDFKQAFESAEGIIKDDGALEQFQNQLTERQLDLKHRLRTALAAADTLQTRESTLREMVKAKNVIQLEPRELREFKHYKDMVNASHQPFTIHISTLAGPEAHIEVSHVDTVWSLRQRVSAELNQGHHAYQIELSNMQGSGRLENDSAVLGECLLCSSEGEELVATYKEADRWVELSHPELEEFRRKESYDAACLHRAAKEAEKIARLFKSQGNIADSMVKNVEACLHKTWQEATFEDILIDTIGMFNHDYGRRRQALKRMVRKLNERGLIEN